MIFMILFFSDLFVHGTKGFLSTNMSSKRAIGFAMYCRNRIKSVDPRFRQDQYYIFFLLLIKEKIEIKRSLQTFMRQARRLPSLNMNNLAEIRLENLEKYNRTYSVYKNLRGSAMYYQSMKRDAMATLRQLGSPTLFFTVSFAEFQSKALFHQIVETVLNRTLTEDEISQMEFTSTEKNKITTENVVQSTLYFEKRLQKLFSLLTSQGFETAENSNSKYRVSEFFYRIEFQMR